MTILLKIFSFAKSLFKVPSQIAELHDLVLYHQTKQIQLESCNPLSKFGKKCFSQTDEDGITLEILRRIDSLHGGGVFAEFGVGNGMENNSLILAALGWKGFWVGGQDIVLNVEVAVKNKRFAFLKTWVTRENIIELTKAGLKEINEPHIDVLSLDLDGNDYYFVDTLLIANIRPKLFIVEYNAKFPPPVEFIIGYNSEHIWQGDDYFGASLTSFSKLFQKHNYRLICCNAQSGANAFFIDRAFDDKFADIPADINELYVEPRYQLYHKHDHSHSTSTVEQLLNKSGPLS